MGTIQTKQGDREILGGEGNGQAPSEDWFGDQPAASLPEGVRAHPVTGEVKFTDHKGRSWMLRPTFEAVLEIEDTLRVSVDGLRIKFASTLWRPDVAPTTREYGVILAAGMRAAGNPPPSVDAATRFAFECGRERLRPILVEFLWALSEGGRGRAEDLKKEGSSRSSLEVHEKAANQLIDQLERRSENTSGSPL